MLLILLFILSVNAQFTVVIVSTDGYYKYCQMSDLNDNFDYMYLKNIMFREFNEITYIHSNKMTKYSIVYLTPRSSDEASKYIILDPKGEIHGMWKSIRSEEHTSE